jgi:hypothetical protein
MVRDETRRLGSQHDGPPLHHKGSTPRRATRARAPAHRPSQRRATFASHQQHISTVICIPSSCTTSHLALVLRLLYFWHHQLASA